MKRTAAYLIPTLTIIIFVAVMQGGIYYFTPKELKNSLPRQVQQIENDILSSHWDNAGKDQNKLHQTWEKLIPLIEYHAEKDAIDGIIKSLGRLDGAIKARDRGDALAELGEITEHWDNLTN